MIIDVSCSPFLTAEALPTEVIVGVQGTLAMFPTVVLEVPIPCIGSLVCIRGSNPIVTTSVPCTWFTSGESGQYCVGSWVCGRMLTLL
jgi:hypothetical protein